jgi:SOS-response transcriptional repressor LexA
VDNAVSWNSELPSGRSPFWVRDEAMAALGLHPGGAVSVDTRRDPTEGDLVVVELEVDDESIRTIRFFYTEGERFRFTAASSSEAAIEVDPDACIVMGVVHGRLRFEERAGQLAAIEEPITPEELSEHP